MPDLKEMLNNGIKLVGDQTGTKYNLERKVLNHLDNHLDRLKQVYRNSGQPQPTQAIHVADSVYELFHLMLSRNNMNYKVSGPQVVSRLRSKYKSIDNELKAMEKYFGVQL